MALCKRTAKGVLFNGHSWFISSTDSKVRTKIHVAIIESGSERADVFT